MGRRAPNPGDQSAIEVAVSYRRCGGRMGAVARDVRSGKVLLAAFGSDPASALRAAARLLACCDRRGYRVARIEPFPWAWDASAVFRAMRAFTANDGAFTADERPTRRARG
jgi:hypothetical protein